MQPIITAKPTVFVLGCLHSSCRLHPFRSGLNNLHLGKNGFTDALAKPLIQSMARLKNPLVTWPSYRLLGADCISGPRSVQGLLGVEILLLQNISNVWFFVMMPELNTCTAEIEVKY